MQYFDVYFVTEYAIFCRLLNNQLPMQCRNLGPVTENIFISSHPQWWIMVLIQLKNFFISSATSGGILDRAIEAEDRKHGDFLRLVRLLCPILLLCYSV